MKAKKLTKRELAADQLVRRVMLKLNYSAADRRSFLGIMIDTFGLSLTIEEMDAAITRLDKSGEIGVIEVVYPRKRWTRASFNRRLR